MKKIFFILLLAHLSNLFAMEKPNLLQAYKNWASARTIAQFTQSLHNPKDTRSEACRLIPLKQLHAELDQHVKNHLFIQYIAVPAVGVLTLTTAALITYNKFN
jgi:hypothetical protein